MFRIDTPNKAVDLFGAGKHGFRDGDKALGINPTELSAAQQNALQEELAAVVEAAGVVLNKANNAQLLEALKRLIDAQSGNYALDTGAANAYVVALDPAIVAYADGMTVRVKAVNANTGASTLNAGGGAKSLVTDDGAALASGDIPAGGVFTATYIQAVDKFYMNSMVQSEGDARYAQLSQFTGSNQSLATSGYQKLPGGLILQWGQVAGGNGSTNTVILPIAFPTACKSAVISIGASSGVDFMVRAGTLAALSATQIQFNATPATTNLCVWMAIGY